MLMDCFMLAILKVQPCTLVLELALDKAENHWLTRLLSTSDKKVETVNCNLFRSLVVVNLYHLFYCKLILIITTTSFQPPLSNIPLGVAIIVCPGLKFDMPLCL